MLISTYLTNFTAHVPDDDKQFPLEPWSIAYAKSPLIYKHEIVVAGFSLSKVDFDSLGANGWLTDLVIDCSLSLFIKECMDDQEASILRIDCHSLEGASDGLHTILERAEKRSMLFNDLWLVPTRINRNHWILFVIVVKSKKVIVLNPLYEGNNLGASLLEHLQVLYDVFLFLCQLADKAKFVLQKLTVVECCRF